MPEPHETGDRTPAQRAADHASLARLSETLVPALVAKLTGTGLGEVEVREGDWRIRVRRPVTGGPAPAPRRAERPRLGAASHAEARAAKSAPAQPRPEPDARRSAVTSPAVGIFRSGVAVGTAVRAGDRIAVVDLLGIPQDVTAPIDGTLVDVFAQAGEAVEYAEEVAVVEAASPAPASPDPASDGTAASGQDGEA
jgi:acetyl-CoA carboxylase biotin carboxyl carrier protein